MIPQHIKDEAEKLYPVLMQHCNGGHHDMYGMCDVNYYERQAYIAGAMKYWGLIDVLKEECRRVKIQRNEYEQKQIMLYRKINKLTSEIELLKFNITKK